MIVIVSWAIKNNLVYFEDYSGWAYNCDSILGHLSFFSGLKKCPIVAFITTHVILIFLVYLLYFFFAAGSAFYL